MAAGLLPGARYHVGLKDSIGAKEAGKWGIIAGTRTQKLLL
jgi:hypothetical protein